MKKAIEYFAVITAVILLVMLVQVGIRIYNYANSQKIESVLMQPAALWQNRIASPIPLKKISDKYIRDQLISHFASEYLSVNPNIEELNSRDNSSNGTMRYIAASDVIKKWTREIKPELIELANKKIMREIIVDEKNIELKGDYFVVPFFIKTWDTPNDLDASPKISLSSHEMYIKMYFNKKVRTKVGNTSFNAGIAMDNGLPPFAIFEFAVVEVVLR